MQKEEMHRKIQMAKEEEGRMLAGVYHPRGITLILRCFPVGLR